MVMTRWKMQEIKTKHSMDEPYSQPSSTTPHIQLKLTEHL